MRKTCSLAFRSTWLKCGQGENPAERKPLALRKTTVTVLFPVQAYC
jgi:hypothetical protein